MQLSLRERLRAGAGSTGEWLRDREEDLVRRTAELDAKGRRFYDDAARRAEPVLARANSDVRELARLVSGAPPRERAATSTGDRAENESPPSGQKGSNIPGRRDEKPMLMGGAQRIRADQQLLDGARLQRIVNSAPVRQVAGYMARTAGNVTGLGTGVLQTAEDVKDGAALALRLLNPVDPFISPRGEAGWDQVAGAANQLFRYGKTAVTQPGTVVRDLAIKGGQIRRELDPTATPAEPTVAAEMRRNFDIGRNQGELAVNVGGLAIGASDLKAASELARISNADRIATHVGEGFSKAKARHLAKPYTGRGHHAIIPERARLPTLVGGGPFPRVILDSPFNVLKPAGISRGEFYRLHSQVDRQFYGTRFPRRMGPGGWSSKVLGIGKYGPVDRIRFGTPGPTKMVVGGVAVEAGGALNEALYGDE